MNVGITRARSALWVLSSATNISVSPEWGALFRGRFHSAGDTSSPTPTLLTSS
jgi:hypothetical protein